MLYPCMHTFYNHLLSPIRMYENYDNQHAGFEGILYYCDDLNQV